MTRRGGTGDVCTRDLPDSGADDQAVLLSVPKAARRLGVSRSTLYSLMARNQLPYVVLGRCRRIRLTSLDALVDACSRGATE